MPFNFSKIKNFLTNLKERIYPFKKIDVLVEIRGLKNELIAVEKIQLQKGQRLIDGFKKNEKFKVGNTNYGQIIQGYDNGIVGLYEGKAAKENLEKYQDYIMDYYEDYRIGFAGCGFEVYIKENDKAHFITCMYNFQEYRPGLENIIVDLNLKKELKLVLKYTDFKEDIPESYKLTAQEISKKSLPSVTLSYILNDKIFARSINNDLVFYEIEQGKFITNDKYLQIPLIDKNNYEFNVSKTREMIKKYFYALKILNNIVFLEYSRPIFQINFNLENNLENVHSEKKAKDKKNYYSKAVFEEIGTNPTNVQKVKNLTKQTKIEIGLNRFLLKEEKINPATYTKSYFPLALSSKPNKVKKIENSYSSNFVLNNIAKNATNSSKIIRKEKQILGLENRKEEEKKIREKEQIKEPYKVNKTKEQKKEQNINQIEKIDKKKIENRKIFRRKTREKEKINREKNLKRVEAQEKEPSFLLVRYKIKKKNIPKTFIIKNIKIRTKTIPKKEKLHKLKLSPIRIEKKKKIEILKNIKKYKIEKFIVENYGEGKNGKRNKKPTYISSSKSY
ncbi:MAG: hypothetical protein N3D10_03040 [Candidatus Micrarchaeota archaeon]|nr:hypothetical protein [Candidatus Micrarchaeota archaeon]